MKLKTWKMIRLLLAIAVLVFPAVRSVATKGGFDFVIWVYVVELILIVALFAVHKSLRKWEGKPNG